MKSLTNITNNKLTPKPKISYKQLKAIRYSFWKAKHRPLTLKRK